MRLYDRAGTRFIWCEGRDIDGKPWRESTKQTSRASAIIAARKIERRRLLDADQTENTATLREARAALKADDERANRPAGTREYHKTKIRHVKRLLGDAVRLMNVREYELREYADKRLEEGASQHTIHKEIIVLRKAARLVGADIPKTAVPDLGRYYVPRERWLPVKEYTALIMATPHTWRDYVIAFCHTGVRWSELFSIEATHVNRDERILLVPGKKTDGSYRTIPLGHDALEVFARRAQETKTGPLFASEDKTRFKRMLTKAASSAEIVYAGPNDFRRTYCSWLANRGVPEAVAARLLGNSSRMVRRVYAQITVGTLSDAAEMLPRVTSRTALRTEKIG